MAKSIVHRAESIGLMINCRQMLSLSEDVATFFSARPTQKMLQHPKKTAAQIISWCQVFLIYGTQAQVQPDLNISFFIRSVSLLLGDLGTKQAYA